MWEVIWKSLVLAAAGTFFIRFAGRKSVSQMTTAQVAVLLAIGTVLGTGIDTNGIFETILTSGTFIAFLIGVEYIVLWWNRAETIIEGKSIPVIMNGQIDVKKLKQLRMSVDDLEKRLRMAGISHISDVKTGTIEVNGELGYELFPHAKPLTMGDLEQFIKLNFPELKIPQQPLNDGLFTEVEHGSSMKNYPKKLQ